MKRERKGGRIKGKKDLKKQYQKCLKNNLRKDLKADLFRTPKRSNKLLKSKNFLCKKKLINTTVFNQEIWGKI